MIVASYFCWYKGTTATQEINAADKRMERETEKNKLGT
jgi:hypothetical protein